MHKLIIPFSFCKTISRRLTVIIYTAFEGEAIQNHPSLFRRPRGYFLSVGDQLHVEENLTIRETSDHDPGTDFVTLAAIMSSLHVSGLQLPALHLVLSGSWSASMGLENKLGTRSLLWQIGVKGIMHHNCGNISACLLKTM